MKNTASGAKEKIIFIDNAHKQGNDRTCTVVFLIFYKDFT